MKSIKEKVAQQTPSVERFVPDLQQGLSTQQVACNSVDLLYISSKSHSHGIGSAAWQSIEVQYPETKAWELVTPYFEKRNIHFYVNKCGFHIIKFYNKYNPDPHQPSVNEHENNPRPSEEYEFFRFEKVMKK